MLGAWRLKNWWAPKAKALRHRRLVRRALRDVARFPRVHSQKPHGLGGALIVSLTSYPPRFGALANTLKCLLDQTMRADRTIVWIAEADLAQLPADVLALQAHGLEIRPCRDLRSYKKLIPALEHFPESFHVTADDDIFFEADWLEKMVATFDPDQRAIVVMRAHMARIGPDGLLRPYLSWKKETSACADQKPDGLLFPTGGAGALYPPGSFAPEVTDEKLFGALCPHADDLWFFWMAKRRGAGHVRVPGSFDLVNWPDSQAVGLYNDNVWGGGNDAQIRALEKHFGPIIAHRSD